MSKKRDNDPVDRINATYDAAFNDVTELSQEEVRRALADAGVIRDELRARLHARATDLARQIRAGKESAPPALKRLLEQTADARELPDNAKRALEKASQLLEDFFAPRLGGSSPEIVGAFRGEGDLTERDQETLDDLDAELLQRAKDADGEEKP